MIQSKLIPIDWLPVGIPHGYANGYVGLPPAHPWFDMDYNAIPAEVHGGLTYGEDHFPRMQPDGLYWIGFDTCHSGDDSISCNQEYCEHELEKLCKQAEEAML